MHTHFEQTKEKIVALVNEKFDRPKNKVDENNSGVENSGETGKLNVNKDGQMTNNKVSGVQNYDNKN